MNTVKLQIQDQGLYGVISIFWWTYTTGKGGGGIYGTIFMPRVFHACYLHLKKEEWNKTEKTAMLLQQNAILLVDNKQNT